MAKMAKKPVSASSAKKAAKQVAKPQRVTKTKYLLHKGLRDGRSPLRTLK